MREDYYFQMFYDDLPIWGFIGRLEPAKTGTQEQQQYFIYTHVQFEVAYNGDRIIEINVRTDPQVAVRPRLLAARPRGCRGKALWVQLPPGSGLSRLRLRRRAGH